MTTRLYVVDMETYDRARCTQRHFNPAVLFMGSSATAITEWARWKAEGRIVRVLNEHGQDLTPLPHHRVKKNKGRKKF